MVKKHAKLRMICLVLVVLVLMALIFFLVGRSFGFFQYAKKGEVVNVVTINGLSVSIDNATDNSLNLTDAYPMYDSQGLESAPFTLTITNTSSKVIDYELSLVNDMEKQENCVLEDEVTPCTQLPYQYIRYAIQLLDYGYSEPATLSSNGKMFGGKISANDSITISIKIWISDSAPNSIQGNVFYGKLVITGEQSLFNPDLPSTIDVGDSYVIAREAYAGETISCSSDIDGSVTNTSTLSSGFHNIACISTIGNNSFTSVSFIQVLQTTPPG